MKFNSAKMARGNEFDNNKTTVTGGKDDSYGFGVSQGDFNLKGGKYIIEMKYGDEFGNQLVGIAEDFPDNDYNVPYYKNLLSFGYNFYNGFTFVKGQKCKTFDMFEKSKTLFILFDGINGTVRFF